MTVLLAWQALPLAVVVGLLASGRVGPVPACLAALACALPAATVAAGGDLAGFMAHESLRGAWLAAPPVAIVVGGLLFHAATERADGPVAGDAAEQIFTASFLLGPVRGGGDRVRRRLDLRHRGGAPGRDHGCARGGDRAAGPFPSPLGRPGAGHGAGRRPGGCAGAQRRGAQRRPVGGVPASSAAAVLVVVAAGGQPRAGRAAPGAGRLGLAAVGALLVLWSRVLPWEVAGVLATGPVLVAKLLAAVPPRGAAAWGRALRRSAPYVALVGAILLTRLWTLAPAWQPFAELPALPLTHVAVALWAVAGLFLLLGRVSPGPALRRARRPALAILCFVVLSRWLAAIGTPAALAGALAAGLGGFARYGAPVLALLSGFVGGSNVASNAMMMPLQATLGRLDGLPATLLPSVQNFCGAQASMFSPQVAGVFGGLAGTTPGPIWRIAWPVFGLILVIGLLTVAIG